MPLTGVDSIKGSKPSVCCWVCPVGGKWGWDIYSLAFPTTPCPLTYLTILCWFCLPTEDYARSLHTETFSSSSWAFRPGVAVAPRGARLEPHIPLLASVQPAYIFVIPPFIQFSSNYSVSSVFALIPDPTKAKWEKRRKAKAIASI